MIRVATRGSELARAQTKIVTDKLADLGMESDVVVVETTGDIDTTTPVTSLTETGAFVRSVQQAVLDDMADLTVHSHKDLPTTGPSGLAGVVVDRGEPWDVLCFDTRFHDPALWNRMSGPTLEDLPEGAVVGTGSPRRSTQLQLLRPDLRVIGIRGNVPTRLKAVEEGKVAAVVLAEAGIARLELTERVGIRFGPEEMTPAPAQGSILVEARPEHRDLLSQIENVGVSPGVTAERELLLITGAGCRSSLGAWGRTTPDGTVLTAFVSDDDGPRRVTVTGDDPEEAARMAGSELGLVPVS